MSARDAFAPPPGPSATRRRALCAALAATLMAAPLPALAQQKLTLWSGWTELKPFYERVAAQFKKKHPDVDISVEVIALREHEKRIALAMPSGAAADIIEMQVEYGRYAEAGLLPPANAAATAFVSDPKHFDKFVQDAVSVSGKVYGVPLFRGQTVLFYNTDMFAKAGLSGPPKTMEDYTTYAEKLTQRDSAGKPTVSGWSLRLSGGGMGIAEKFWINMHQYGGAVVREKNGKWFADYANEAGRKTLKQYLDNVIVKKTVSPEMKADAEAFSLGQTAMFIRESWVIGDIAKKAPGLPYATAPLPKGSIVIPVGLYVPTKDAKKAALAWDYTLMANEPENLVWLLDNVGWLPNRKDVDYSGVIKAKPAFEAFVNYPKDHSFFTLPFITPVSEVLTRLAARLEKGYLDPALAGNDAAIDAFLKAAADETNTILKREGFYGAP
ncbi:MAG: extracellular solute-binding protein [Methylobacteriaceae bacterium]|nr:extracellular solute-binding protein [Methylobacteriaceae bacterium]